MGKNYVFSGTRCVIVNRPHNALEIEKTSMGVLCYDFNAHSVVSDRFIFVIFLFLLTFSGGKNICSLLVLYINMYTSVSIPNLFIFPDNIGTHNCYK